MPVRSRYVRFGSWRIFEPRTRFRPIRNECWVVSRAQLVFPYGVVWILFFNSSWAMFIRIDEESSQSVMSMNRPPSRQSEANQVDAPPMASSASIIVAWTAIIFICPVALAALYFLVPNTLELLDRVLHYPVAPRRPLILMLLTQVAVLTLPAMTFVSWLHDRKGTISLHHTSKTVRLGSATFGLGLFAYLWIAMQLARFGN